MAGRGGGVRRWGPGLALLALALGPALALIHLPRRDTVPPGDTAARETLPPETPLREPAAEPPPPAAMPAAVTAAIDLPEAGMQPAATAPFPAPPSGGTKSGPPPRPPERWAGNPACPRDRRSTREYNRCLFDFTRTSEQELEAELANALVVIDARSDLPAVQRTRWRSLLDEAQSRFLLYRNFDCQSVAPFEGPRGIGNFEQRSLCLIEANTRRARELRARYGSPMTVLPELSGGPWARGGTYVRVVPPSLQ